jgi:hypothetical protein
MFSSFFSSKEQKLVKKWKKEHEQIVALAHKVIAEYSKNNTDNAKKELKALNVLAIDHIMNEDIEFYRLQKNSKKIDEETEKLMKEFTHSFKGTKIALMKFLTKYTKDDAVLDDEFFTTFNDIVAVLAERIDFEEKNLYADLSSK